MLAITSIQQAEEIRNELQRVMPTINWCIIKLIRPGREIEYAVTNRS